MLSHCRSRVVSPSHEAYGWRKPFHWEEWVDLAEQWAGDPGQSRERRHKPSRGTAGAVCSAAGARPLPDRQLRLPGTLEVEDYPQGSVNSAHLLETSGRKLAPRAVVEVGNREM